MVASVPQFSIILFCPPGWNGMYCVTSYTLLFMISQQLAAELCVATIIGVRFAVACVGAAAF